MSFADIIIECCVLYYPEFIQFYCCVCVSYSHPHEYMEAMLG